MFTPKIWTQSEWHDYLAIRNSKLPALPVVTELSAEVVRILGGNPGDMQLQGTNTYLVGSGQTRILIDTGQGCQLWIETLVNFLKQHHLSISQVLLTHWHSDHTGGLRALLCHYPHLEGAIYKADPDRGQNPIHDGQIFATDGATIQAFFTPGHSTDHMCFILEETGAIFTGDNILGHGTSVVVENLGLYLKSIQKMRQRVHSESIRVGYPGHGAVIEDPTAKLMVYARHWEVLEKAVYSTFMTGSLKEKALLTAREVTSRLYGTALETMVGPFITQVLYKLAEQGELGFTVVGGAEKKWFVLRT
ncbi:hypothetical protein PENARI_c007G12135 [Penicillium arizonense]|uniref:Metallo-beta-lactamase domain-containing protein n=1 Tax=Penicillium arizonense TaxID=1835702 RepID=A0A1F5LLJ5_PENAI|nr:hypothetical protein PENARI_c007G12135 [Penicillium arizonense]OGE53880.1 hypothetical protein PENARI_c007G12135 [Penicillium arizonense]